MRYDDRYLYSFGFTPPVSFLFSFSQYLLMIYKFLQLTNYDNIISTMASSLIDLAKKQIFSSTQKKSLKPLISIFGLWALEKLLENTTYYNCPNEGYALYGGMFLFAPALCLFSITLMMSNSFWDSVTSCFRRRKVDRVVVCRATCHALMKSALVALAWLILTFATTNYFVCFSIGNNPNDSIESIKMQRLSSIIAWSMLLISAILSLIYSFINKCCFLNDQESIRTVVCDYERIEAETAISTFKTEAKILAKKEGERKVKAILDEVKDGKPTLEVVKKAKEWLFDRYSRSKSVEKDDDVSDVLLEEIHVEKYAKKETILLQPYDSESI